MVHIHLYRKKIVATDYFMDIKWKQNDSVLGFSLFVHKCFEDFTPVIKKNANCMNTL